MCNAGDNTVPDTAHNTGNNTVPDKSLSGFDRGDNLILVSSQGWGVRSPVPGAFHSANEDRATK